MTETQAEALREAGLTKVIQQKKDWVMEAHRTIRRLIHGWTGTGEEIRELVELMNGPAHHPNVWGAIIMTAVRDRTLIPTGEWRKGKSPQGHARQVRVYIRR